MRRNNNNGKIYSSVLFNMNNRGLTNYTQAVYRNQGKIFSSALSQRNPYYTNANPRWNPGTSGLRLVVSPKPNHPGVEAERIKPDSFGKSRSVVEQNTIHKSTVIGATNGARTGNSHTD